MAAFRPWVWKEHIEPAHGAWCEEMFDGVCAFDAQEAQIGDRRALGFAARIARSAEEALGAEIIALGMLTGHGHQE